MVVIDASVWVARSNMNDKFHEQAKSIFESLDLNGGAICIPAIAFTEVAGAIKRITKDDHLAWGTVYDMKEMELEVYANFDKLEPLATEIAINYGVRGADAYYLAVAKLTQSKLYTFDEQQGEAFDAMSKTW